MVPKSIKQFVKDLPTKAVKDIVPESLVKLDGIPYTEYWRRAIAAMLLSGRVKAKVDGFPNMTDVYRVGKEANFNPYLFERTSQFFVLGDIIQPERRRSNYLPGKWAEAFWDRDVSGLQQASRSAFIGFVGKYTGSTLRRPTRIQNAQLDVFLILFAQAFQGLAIKDKIFGQALLDFSQLPAGDLKSLAKDLGYSLQEGQIAGWKYWLDQAGQEAIQFALTLCNWAYVNDDKKPQWMFVSEEALLMLGITKPPQARPLARDFQVLPNLAILAGADWGPDKLIPLFRYCKVKRIDRVLEFQLNKKQMMALPSTSSATDELSEVLAEQRPWPSPVESFLKGKVTLATGEVKIQGCSAILQPENAEVLEAIKSHPRLKNYLEAKPPAGYLLIKSTSDPYNFIARCRELGFQVKSF